MSPSLRLALIALPLLAGTSLAWAQTSTQQPGQQAPRQHPAQHVDDQASKPGSLPDQNAKQEPSAKNKPDTHPAPGVFVDGALAVPGAPAESQTRPAKFSAANDAQDKIPIMARGPQLTVEQKKLIADALRQAPSSTQAGEAAPATELPATVELQEWPSGLVDQVPAVRGTKYVRVADRIMIVQPPNRIVVGEIAQ